MPDTLKLSDVFGDLEPIWPREFRPANIGDFEGWLSMIDTAIDVYDLRSDVVDGTVSVEATLDIRPSGVFAVTSLLGGPAIPMFWQPSLVDIGYHIMATGDEDEPSVKSHRVRLLVVSSGTETEVVLENVPLEIMLPRSILCEHPNSDLNTSEETEESEETQGSYGALGAHEIRFRSTESTGILTRARIHITPQRDIDIQTATPISIGKCRFLGIPCQALHGVHIIPTPEIAHNTHAWITRPIGGDWLARGVCAIGVRGLELDWDYDPLTNVSSFLTRDHRAEWDLEDLVLPVGLLYPPLWGKGGMRRNLIPRPTTDEETGKPQLPSVEDAISLDGTPVLVELGDVDLVVNRLFFDPPSPPTELLTGVSIDLGVQFDAWDEPFQLTIGWFDATTLRLSARREPSTLGTDLPVLRFELFQAIAIDIVSATLGLNLVRLAKGGDFGEVFELFGDILIREIPSESSPDTTTTTDSDGNEIIKIRTANGGPFQLLLSGVGWRDGGFKGDILTLPDGVTAEVGPFGIYVEEIGSVAERGATYFSITGGLLVDSGDVDFKGWFRRLRWRMSGDESAPVFLLDGFGIKLEVKDSFTLEVFGGYTQDIVDTLVVDADDSDGDGDRDDLVTLEDAYERREVFLAGKLDITAGGDRYLFALDLKAGELIPQPGKDVEGFIYFMLQFAMEAKIPIATFELRGLRVLFAYNMIPALGPVEESEGELRYFNWSRKTDPTTVDADRRLAAWKPSIGGVSVGAGLTASFTGCGEAMRLRLFVLVVISREGSGFMISGELFLLKATNPSAWAVIEYDEAAARFAAIIGIDLKISQFIEDPNEFLDELFKLTGTLFISSLPATVALGRIDDRDTWLTLRFDLKAWSDRVRVLFLIALCFEWVDGVRLGFGLAFRAEGAVNLEVIRVEGYTGFSFEVKLLLSGSGDLALTAMVEAGLVVEILWIFRLGIRVAAQVQHVAHEPKFTVVSADLVVETPFFLPDVTVHVEAIDGEVGVARRPIVTKKMALTDGSADHDATERNFDIFTMVDDQDRLYSLEELRATSFDVSAARAAFESLMANGDQDAFEPVPTDATIALTFGNAVVDELGFGATNRALGEQVAGDESCALRVRERLIGLRIRRRDRFGDDNTWHDVGTIDLAGEDELPFAAAWNEEMRADGQLAAKQLLLNATAPFRFTPRSPRTDEEIVEANPSWPCCGEEQLWDWMHTLDFREEPFGHLRSAPIRSFSGTRSTAWPAAGFVKPPLAEDEPRAVASFDIGTTDARVMRCAFDEDFVALTVRCAALGKGVVVATFRALDVDGDPVPCAIQSITPQHYVVGATLFGIGGMPWGDVAVYVPAGARSLEIDVRVATREDEIAEWGRKVDAQWTVGMLKNRDDHAVFEVDRLSYLDLRLVASLGLRADHCPSSSDEAAAAFEGSGKVSLLANQQYEVVVVTEVAVCHSTTDWETVERECAAHFATKGLPGFNAVDSVGQELDPYVASAYAGGRGLVYRAEPVALVFSEDLGISVPLSTDGDGPGELALTTRPDTAADDVAGPVATATGTDWILAHQVVVDPLLLTPWPLRSSTFETGAWSDAWRRVRLAGLTQRADAHCDLADPRDVDRGGLLAGPGALEDLWEPSRAYTATVRPNGAPFVWRTSFDPANLTAFMVIGDGLTVVEGALQHDGASSAAVFGDEDWDHYRCVTIVEGAGRAGVVVSVRDGDVSDGIFATVSTTSEGEVLTLGIGPDDVARSVVLEPSEEPRQLSVDVFDDRVRATVAESVVELPRHARREGRCALYAEGEARFGSLQVEGIEMFRYPFRTSRYETFTQHIDSWDRTSPTMPPDLFGDGSRVATVAGLLAETGAEIAASMSVDEPDSRRDAVFARWVSDLALGLAEAPEHLQISVIGDHDVEALLIESPEPLDFVDEVSVALRHREVQPHRTPLDRIRELLDELRRRGVLGPIQPATPRPLLHIDTLRKLASTTVKPTLGDLDNLVRKNTRDIVQGPPRRIERSMKALPAKLETTRSRRPIEAWRSTSPRKLSSRELAVHIGAQPNTLEIATENGTSVETVALPAGVLEGLEPGLTIGVDVHDLGFWVHNPPTSSVRWVDHELTIIQDATRCRAILIPTASGLTAPVARQPLWLEFGIERRRWDTTDPTDDLNTYHDSHTLELHP